VELSRCHSQARKRALAAAPCAMAGRATKRARRMSDTTARLMQGRQIGEDIRRARARQVACARKRMRRLLRRPAERRADRIAAIASTMARTEWQRTGPLSDDRAALCAEWTGEEKLSCQTGSSPSPATCASSERRRPAWRVASALRPRCLPAARGVSISGSEPPPALETSSRGTERPRLRR
jgi:hypothetical protein